MTTLFTFLDTPYELAVTQIVRGEILSSFHATGIIYPSAMHLLGIVLMIAASQLQFLYHLISLLAFRSIYFANTIGQCILPEVVARKYNTGWLPLLIQYIC